MTYEELVARFRDIREIASEDGSVAYESPTWQYINRLDLDLDRSEAKAVLAAKGLSADMSAPENLVSEAEWSGEDDANSLSHLGSVTPRELKHRILLIHNLWAEGLSGSVEDNIVSLMNDMGFVDAG